MTDASDLESIIIPESCDLEYDTIGIKCAIEDLPALTQIAIARPCKELESPAKAAICPAVVADGEHYYHHGVFLGRKWGVIHFHGDDKTRARIHRCSVEDFIGPDENNVKICKEIRYKKPSVVKTEDTKRRIKEVLKNPEKWGNYDLELNNCETFATWLMTGAKRSAQAEYGIKQILWVGGILVAILFACIQPFTNN